MNEIYICDGGTDDRGILLVLDEHTVLWNDGTITTYWFKVVDNFERDYRSQRIL